MSKDKVKPDKEQKLVYRQQLRRIDKCIKLGLPEILIKYDVALLLQRYCGGRFKVVLFTIKYWWTFSKVNIVFHYKMRREIGKHKKDEKDRLFEDKIRGKV